MLAEYRCKVVFGSRGLGVLMEILDNISLCVRFDIPVHCHCNDKFLYFI